MIAYERIFATSIDCCPLAVVVGLLAGVIDCFPNVCVRPSRRWRKQKVSIRSTLSTAFFKRLTDPLPACAPDADCSVCQSGYSASLSATCTRCSPSRRQWLLAVTLIVGTITIGAMVAFAVYLMSTNFDSRETTYIHQTFLRRVPLQSFKSIVVVWQILTQVSLVTSI